MNEVKLKAYAKINIGLDVLNRKPDGYHNVRMVMQTIELYDKLRIKREKEANLEESKITIHTNLPYLPTDQRNLVYQIIEELLERFDIKASVFVDLYKMIPVAAGLAGGSTDAAATIIGMNDLFDFGMTMEDMVDFGKSFGADIPYCMYGGTALVEGIGEELTFLDPFPDSYVVIVKPKFSVSTAYVYRNLKIDKHMKHPDIDGIMVAIKAYRRDIIGSLMGNVLETVTIKDYPIIENIKTVLSNAGAYGTLMSGSGPTVFGLFEDRHTAQKAKKMIMKEKGIGENIQFLYVTSIYNRKRV
jgi:4-diphosphocytidyl-2-C-methyl-D-erythritol kinase